MASVVTACQRLKRSCPSCAVAIASSVADYYGGWNGGQVTPSP